MTQAVNIIAEKWFAWELTMLWQVAVLIGIVWALDFLIRKWAWPQVRYALWLLVLVKLVLPPGLTSPTSFTAEIPFLAKRVVEVQISRLQIARPPEQIVTGGEPVVGTVPKPLTPYSQIPAQTTRPAAEAVSQRPAAVTAALSWKAYAFFVWLGGIAVLSGWLIIRLAGLRREHLKAGHQANLPERFAELVTAAGRKLKLKKTPQVILTNKVSCPAVFGVFRPVLLMPADKLKSLTRQDAEHIILHELAHIKRGDLLIHAVYMSLQIAYWFNPLLWLIRRHLQNLRELCCDATVARILKEKTPGYRETLLETARQLLAEPVEAGLGLLGLFENSNQLVDRLRWLEKKTWKHRPLRIMTIFVLVCLMGVCVLPMAKLDPGPPRFVIKGTVTDAESGQPIAAAKVGDNKEYNDGKSCTVTDSNGNYEYKTWYEEHGTIAEADGYKLQLKGFNTKLFGSEKEKVIDFQLQPETTDPELSSRLRSLVEDFFKHNYRDITARKTIEWGESAVDAKGNISIRYKYEATIWDKDKIITDQLFVFDKDGKLLSYDKISPFAVGSKQWMQERVEGFFKNNYRDITARKTIEWSEPVNKSNDSYSIRYKYEATIWGKDNIVDNKVFTFNKEGNFISVADVEGYPKKLDNTSLKIETNDGFKETIKEILPAAEGRNAKLLDIDTGKWGRKSDFGQNDRETHKWVRENGLDLLGFFEKGQFGLLAFDVAVLPVKSPDWQRLAAKDIIENKLLDQVEPNKITPMLPVETADAPATYLFRTRENGIGILQITGFSKNPKGVKVWYKLVGNPTGQVEGARKAGEQVVR